MQDAPQATPSTASTPFCHLCPNVCVEGHRSLISLMQLHFHTVFLCIFLDTLKFHGKFISWFFSLFSCFCFFILLLLLLFCCCGFCRRFSCCDCKYFMLLIRSQGIPCAFTKYLPISHSKCFFIIIITIVQATGSKGAGGWC